MKRYHSIGILLLAVTSLLTLALIASFAVDSIAAQESRARATRVPTAIDISNDLFAAVQMLRTERGTVNASLATPVEQTLQNVIPGMHVRSELALDAALARLKTVTVEGVATGRVVLRRDRRSAAEMAVSTSASADSGAACNLSGCAWQRQQPRQRSNTFWQSSGATPAVCKRSVRRQSRLR